MILEVIRHYFPDWVAPEDKGRDWIKCLCPFHPDTNPSAVVSYRHNAFKCYACGTKGDYLAIIKNQEGCSYRESYEIAKRLAETSNRDLPRPAKKQSGGRIHFSTGPATGEGAPVSSGIRGRRNYWS